MANRKHIISMNTGVCIHCGRDEDEINQGNVKCEAVRGAGKAGPLEVLTLKNHCEMCGADRRKVEHLPLEPGFRDDGTPATLCYPCRIGSWELMQEQVQDLLAAAKRVTRGWSKNNLAEHVRNLDAVIRRNPASRFIR